MTATKPPNTPPITVMTAPNTPPAAAAVHSESGVTSTSDSHRNENTITRAVSTASVTPSSTTLGRRGLMSNLLSP